MAEGRGSAFSIFLPGGCGSVRRRQRAAAFLPGPEDNSVPQRLVVRPVISQISRFGHTCSERQNDSDNSGG